MLFTAVLDLLTVKYDNSFETTVSIRQYYILHAILNEISASNSVK